MQCVGGCSCVYAVCSSCTRSCGCDSVLFEVSFVENKQFNLLKILCLSVQVEERRGNNQVIIDRFSCNERISLLLLCSDSFESLFFFVFFFNWTDLACGISLSLSLIPFAMCFLMPSVAITLVFTVSMSLIIRQHDIPLRALNPCCCYATPASNTNTFLYLNYVCIFPEWWSVTAPLACALNVCVRSQCRVSDQWCC